MLGICEAIELVEVALADSRRDVDARGDDDDAQNPGFQKADITFVVPAKAVTINEDARRRALRASFLVIAVISLLAIFPAARLPKYVPGELSAADIVSKPSGPGAP